MGSELVEAKNRISELEIAQSNDRDALRLAGNNLSSASEEISKLAQALKTQQSELQEALVASGVLEEKLTMANER